MTIVPNGANNRMTRWGGKTYSYDPNGNLLADGTHSYQWNERNQLTGLSAGATSLASFSYDSLGRRSAKTVAGATTGFVYDGDTFVQELLGASSNSAVKAQLLTGGIDETFLRIEGTSRHSFLADGNNNTVRLLDANQTKVVDYTYEPYGRTTADATNGNTQQYTGSRGQVSQFPERGPFEPTWDRGNGLTQIVDRTFGQPTTSLNCATVATSHTITRLLSVSRGLRRTGEGPVRRSRLATGSLLRRSRALADEVAGARRAEGSTGSAPSPMRRCLG